MMSCISLGQRATSAVQEYLPGTILLVLLAGGCAPHRPIDPGAYAPPPNSICDEDAVVRGDVSRRRIALIFTGGSYGEGTEHILDVLHAAGVPGSFFVTGEYLARPEHAALLRRIVAEGHYLGPHSHGHLLYCAWEDRARTLVTRELFAEDLRRNLAEVRRYGGPVRASPAYFIPPYEWFNAEQVAWARALGMVLFNFTPGSGSNRDWIPEGQPGFVSGAEIVRGILDYEQRDPHGLNGFLLLLHLGSQRADKVHLQFGPLLEELLRRGYTFVRIDEMLAPSVPRP